MLVWFAAARGIGQRMPKTHRNATAQLFCCPIEGGFRSVPPQISNVAKHSSTGGETEFQKSDNKHHKTQQIAWCYHTDRVELHVGLCLLAMCTLDLEPAFSLRKFKKKKTTSLIMLPPPPVGETEFNMVIYSTKNPLWLCSCYGFSLKPQQSKHITGFQEKTRGKPSSSLVSFLTSKLFL